MLYALIFPTPESWEEYVHRALRLLLTGASGFNAELPID